MAHWRTNRSLFHSAAVIVNPTAGRNRAGRALPEMRKRLEEFGLDATYHFTRASGDGHALALAAIDGGRELIVAMGGDGTLHEVTNAILESGRPSATLGLIPFGTGNDFARGVGLFGDPAAACEALIGGERRLLDVGRVEGRGLGAGRWFLTAAGVGLVADTAKFVNEGVRFLHGAPAYIYGLLRTLQSFKPMHIEIVVNGERLKISQATLVSISNVETTGGGLKIAPGATPDDGWLNVCLVAAMPKAELLRQLPKVAIGKHVDHPSVCMLRAQSVAIDTVETCALWIDGEVIGHTPAYFAVEKARLPMMIPLQGDTKG